MGVAEVVGFEGDGRGVTGLLRLWKRVEECEVRNDTAIEKGYRSMGPMRRRETANWSAL